MMCSLIRRFYRLKKTLFKSKAKLAKMRKFKCVLILFCFVVFFFLLSMCDFNLGVLNLNGARADFKRAALFKLMEIEKIDIMFVQETHRTSDNESEWRRAFTGRVVLSHKSSCSGGVGILFSQSFSPVSFEFEEINPGVLLKVKATVFSFCF